ncbi:hypothetical protein BJI47_16105 [Rhodococcus sp. 1168]|nr:hypothetical protein BJI47_16105 [Rhodococcus sp. 1168]
MPVPEGKDPGLVHVMVEVDQLDAVGRALDEVTKLKFPVHVGMCASTAAHSRGLFDQRWIRHR